MPAAHSEVPVEWRGGAEDDLIPLAQEYLRLRNQRLLPGPALATAWQQFYELHAPRIRTIVASCGLRGADLEECVQDAWLLVIRKLPLLEYDPSHGQFAAWLHHLVRCRAIDHLRRRARRDLASPTVLQVMHYHLVGRRGPDCTSDHENLEQLTIVLARLEAKTPEQSYRVFYLRRLRERPVAEVARELNLTPAQVRARQHRVERKLRGMLLQAEHARSEA